jgi:hypothetical protein
MKLALISIFVLVIMVSSAIQLEKILHKPNLREMHMRNFGARWSNSLKLNIYSLIREEIEREKLKKLERERKEEEEKRRKIMRDHMIPLTRGNNFMKDFYSGRY